jgi:hypothetical protein
MPRRGIRMTVRSHGRATEPGRRDCPTSGLNWSAGWICSGRWILLHMVEEVARHVGHMDVIREQLDGANGHY